MIRQYVETALRKARYEKLRDGTFYGEVPDFAACSLPARPSKPAGISWPRSSKSGSWSGWREA